MRLAKITLSHPSRLRAKAGVSTLAHCGALSGRRSGGPRAKVQKIDNCMIKVQLCHSHNTHHTMAGLCSLHFRPILGPASHGRVTQVLDVRYTAASSNLKLLCSSTIPSTPPPLLARFSSFSASLPEAQEVQPSRDKHNCPPTPRLTTCSVLTLYHSHDY